MLSALVALVALLLTAIVRAETNVTIDDMDPRVVYQPQDVWSFQGNSVNTQDRLNKTTHYTSEIGATASLTFTGAIYVYYIGYPMGGSPPALVPITLQPRHGNAITLQSDAYRAAEAQAQITLFSSDKLDPTETYTITVTKTNATLANDLNIDAFILTQLDGANTSAAQTSDTNFTTGTLTSASPAANSSIANADSTNASINTSTIAGAIAGGVIGGLVIGIAIMFLIFRWWSKRNQHGRRSIGSNGAPSPLPLRDNPRTTDFEAVPWYPFERTSAPSQTTMSPVTDHNSVPPTLARTSLLMSGSTAPGQSPVDGRPRMAQVQRTLAFTPMTHGKTRYMGNIYESYGAPPSPEDTEYRESTPPAYS